MESASCLLKTSEVATVLGLTRARIGQLRRSGLLIAHLHGKRWRYDFASVNAEAARRATTRPANDPALLADLISAK